MAVPGCTIPVQLQSSAVSTFSHFSITGNWLSNYFLCTYCFYFSYFYPSFFLLNDSSSTSSWLLDSEFFSDMEFLDNNITKNSSLLLHALHSPFYWRVLKKTILFSGYKNPYKNPRDKKTRVYSWIGFWRTENEGRKPGNNLNLRRLETFFCPQFNSFVIYYYFVSAVTKVKWWVWLLNILLWRLNNI